MIMNLRDLKYLIAVAEHLHFGKAAESCHVSQPALSMQLSKLEDFLGVKLIERTNKKVLITDVGEKIVERAKDAIRASEEIIEIADTFKSPFVGDFKLGAFPTLAPYYFSQIVPIISKAFPDIRLLLIEEKTEILVDKILNGEIDAAFLATPEGDGMLTSAPLFNDEFIYGTPMNDNAVKSITRDELLSEKLLLLEEGHCLRNQALDYCSIPTENAGHDFQATSMETLKQMVSAGVGSTLIPQIARKKDDHIHYVPITPNPPYRTISLNWRKSSPKYPLYEKMVELLKQ
ncbi:LysR substrate-binding domain-containing protein [Pseudemcibacter aquimaris]|uniref:LysR substrate-binding domain-containing protein n=1 Tax=Pseudemcibacter aquimaris TaxID=2857064 RepID=UPI0020112CCC|nr:LysR substrate-binding domain-containing protein [Pseudemcibacter aquimaris]MCC3862551.1 LysR family transcriptional regulator [Pseudemcibacter aquimaris]WDU57930.1 LysR family transcriptional regulator [Pseudemcibacter aquimaris]